MAAKDAKYYAADTARQAAVDKRGYYNAGDIAYAKTDPKMRRNFAVVEKGRKGKRGSKRR